METEILKVNSKMYSFGRMENETDESYFIRRDFFMTISPQNNKEYVNAISMSIVLSNMKILDCVYSPEVVEYLNKMLSAKKN